MTFTVTHRQARFPVIGRITLICQGSPEICLISAGRTSKLETGDAWIHTPIPLTPDAKTAMTSAGKKMKSCNTVLMLLLCFGSLNARAQDDPSLEHDFTFVRLQYDTAASGFYSYRYGSWSIDHPAADLNFLRGVIRLTSIRADPEPVVLRLDDDRIFNYPFLYGLEMGQSGGIVLSQKEIENLREFLLRGGFLFIDDFWGTEQWQAFYRTFAKVFPHRELQELHSDHPIFHSFYDIDGPQMIPAIGNRFNYPEEDVAQASNHVILDDHGRIMVLINWNSDIGDGWEHTYHPDYPTKYANLAYQLGINYLVYALTH